MTTTMTKTQRPVKRVDAKRPTAQRPARRSQKRASDARGALVPVGTHFDPAPREAWLKLSQKERDALVKAGRGSLSWIKYSVDEFIAEKRAEAERENRS
jgi:hypothetical protein